MVEQLCELGACERPDLSLLRVLTLCAYADAAGRVRAHRPVLNGGRVHRLERGEDRSHAGGPQTFALEVADECAYLWRLDFFEP
jgi:hypothetical protein